MKPPRAMAEAYANSQGTFDYPDGIKVCAFLAGFSAALKHEAVQAMYVSLRTVLASKRNAHNDLEQDVAREALARFDALKKETE